MSARILVVDDEANIRALIDEILSEEGYDVTTAADAKEARSARKRQDFDLVLLDIWMPDTDGISLLREWSEGGAMGTVVMMSGHGTVDTAVEATRLGAVDFVEKPVSLAKLLRTVERALAVRRNKERAARRSRAKRRPGRQEPADARAARADRARRAAQRAHVVHGRARQRPRAVRTLSREPERPGTRTVRRRHGRRPDGRERAARAHRRRHGARSVSSVPKAESCSFRSSARSALRRSAYCLSALEQGSYRAPGQTADRPFNVRILSSAFQGFERSDTLRPELLSHLSVVVIRVPPLREYPEDVPELLRHHVDLLVDTEGLPFRRFSVAAQNRLRNYPWPRNVRELRNMVKRLLILGGPEEISLSEVEAQLATDTADREPLVKQDLLAMPLREAREHFERAYLQQQLLLCGGKVGQLAKRVGMERTHLYRKLRSFGVDFRQSLTDD